MKSNRFLTRWRPLSTHEVLLFSFFISGACALIYQICWNRALFASIGIDLDSVTIIVSCFMLGIGIGGMLGGYIADRWPEQRINIYIVCELMLAAFGLISLLLIKQASALVSVSGAFGLVLTGVVVFLVLLIPTVVMGMTLPILSLLFESRLKNMGASVGALYFANTLGAALGALIAPFLLFNLIDLQQTVWLAVAGNLSVAGMVRMRWKADQKCA